MLCCVVCDVLPQECQGCIPFFQRVHCSLTFLVTCGITCVCGVLKHATYKETVSYITKSQDQWYIIHRHPTKIPFKARYFRVRLVHTASGIQFRQGATGIPYHTELRQPVFRPGFDRIIRELPLFGSLLQTGVNRSIKKVCYFRL